MKEPRKKNKTTRQPFLRLKKLNKWLLYVFKPPFNIFVFLWWWLKALCSKTGSIYKALGAHFISGYPGSGKTLLCNQLIQSIDKDKYFCLSNIKEFDGVDSFEISDIFQGAKQVKRFPKKDPYGRKLYAVIFDEINLEFNRRMNRTSEYNDLFIGLIEFLVSHRHQGVPRVYFIGQKLDLQDTQLQSLFKFQHDIIDTKRRYKYWHFKVYNKVDQEEKTFVKVPVKLDIVNRVKNLDGDFIEVNFEKIKILKTSLLTYNTMALSSKYEQLDVVKIKSSD